MSISLNKLERCCFSNDVLKLVKEPHAVLVNPNTEPGKEIISFPPRSLL